MSLSPLRLTPLIVTPVHSITSSPSDLSSLAGGETVEINGNFDCSSAQVKIMATRDPCEAGQHNCHHRATCNPTADELDYTCACDSNDSDQGLGYGNEFECYWFVRRGNKEFFDDLTSDFCETSGELSLDVNSKAMEQYPVPHKSRGNTYTWYLCQMVWSMVNGHVTKMMRMAIPS